MKTDSEIQKDVMEELKYVPFLIATEIGVAVSDGVVSLSGTIDSFGKKVFAKKAAERVAGVKAVEENIEVKLIPLDKKNDSEIVEAVLNALKWHSALIEDKIKVSVEGGHISLEGEVEWDFQRNSAQIMVEQLQGIVAITNNINVVSKLKPDDVFQKISSAFKRSATIDAGKINIDVDGKKVTLTGKVNSYAEKLDAEKTAWFAPGVNKVENKLVVDAAVFA